MQAVISFNWRGHNIEQFFDWEYLKDDINEKDDLWGEFVVNGTKFQFQILWESSTITIFNFGGYDYIDSVTNFSVSFSKTFM
jgi:hypothetical protein